MTLIRDELLSLLTEDDYDLPEIAVQVPEARDDLRAAVVSLLADGLAEWVILGGQSGKTSLLSHARTDPPDLSDDSLWTSRDGQVAHFLLTVTPAGWQAYFGHPPEPGDLR